MVGEDHDSASRQNIYRSSTYYPIGYSTFRNNLREIDQLPSNPANFVKTFILILKSSLPLLFMQIRSENALLGIQNASAANINIAEAIFLFPLLLQICIYQSFIIPTIGTEETLE